MSTPVRIHAIAAGGDGIARADDGKIIFVPGGLPNELLDIEIVENKRDFSRGRIIKVLDPSPDRREPSCPHVAAGCGGCGWQHVSLLAQTELKLSIVVDALRRIGRVVDPENLVRSAPSLEVGGHRTTVRVAVSQGQAGFRATGTNRVVVVDSCEVAHSALADLLANGDFSGVEEATMRVSSDAAELLVVASPTAAGVSLSSLTNLTVTVIGDGVLDDATVELPFLMEHIAGVPLRASAGAFFQTRPDGAEQLVRLVDQALGDEDDLLLDLYGGVGLFAATCGQRFATVVSVEENPIASADAEFNLSGCLDAAVVTDDVGTWRPPHNMFSSRRVAIVADPSRAGLGRNGVDSIERLRPEVVVLVSCDAGSLGRDAKLLLDAGFELTESVVVDLFPHTPHVEVVSRFVPTTARRDG